MCSKILKICISQDVGWMEELGRRYALNRIRHSHHTRRTRRRRRTLWALEVLVRGSLANWSPFQPKTFALIGPPIVAALSHITPNIAWSIITLNHRSPPLANFGWSDARRISLSCWQDMYASVGVCVCVCAQSHDTTVVCLLPYVVRGHYTI